MFSGATASEGPGLEWQPNGEYRGGLAAGGSNSVTNRYFVGLDLSALTSMHSQAIGDRFDLQSDGASGGFTGYIVKTAGYRAGHWSAGQAAGTTSYVEPTANATPIPVAGGKVFHCTTPGTTHASVEPTWSTAVNPGDTVSDNGVVWTLLGFVPVYNRIGRIEPPTPSVVTTTDATPTFVILATLAVGDVVGIDVLAKVASSTGSVRQTFKIAAVVYGAAGPTATLDAAPDVTSKGTGTAAVTIDVTGATARLKVTGIVATNLTTTYEVHVL